MVIAGVVARLSAEGGHIAAHGLRRQELLMEAVSPKVSIRSTLITTYGLEHNEYSGVFTNVILLDDLFE